MCCSSKFRVVIRFFFRSLQAIKYLERMLIQAQCQSEREKRCKVTANDSGIKNAEDTASTPAAAATTATGGASTSTPTNEQHSPKVEDTTNCDVKDTANVAGDGDVEMTDISVGGDTVVTKQEAPSPVTTVGSDVIDGDASRQAPATQTSIDQPSESMEVMENGIGDAPAAKQIKIEDNCDDDDDDDPYSTDIVIDPRTYCKLGHFHLLLEDYPKGNFVARIYIRIIALDAHPLFFDFIFI